MAIYKTSTYEIYVSRDIGPTKNHALVKLTLVHDRHDIDLHHEPLLQEAAKMLSAWPRLPDRVSIVLSITDILTHMIADRINEVEAWRFSINKDTIEV
jgi:hypothetical protein